MTIHILKKADRKTLNAIQNGDEDLPLMVVNGVNYGNILENERIFDICTSCRREILYSVASEDYSDNDGYANRRRQDAIDLYNNTINTIYSTIQPAELRDNIRLRNNTKWGNTPTKGLAKGLAAIGEVADRRFEDWEYKIAVLISKIKPKDYIDTKCPHCNAYIKLRFDSDKYTTEDNSFHVDGEFRVVSRFINDLRDLVEEIYKTTEFSIKVNKPVHMSVPDNNNPSEICKLETIKLE